MKSWICEVGRKRKTLSLLKLFVHKRLVTHDATVLSFRLLCTCTSHGLWQICWKLSAYKQLWSFNVHRLLGSRVITVVWEKLQLYLCCLHDALRKCVKHYQIVVSQSCIRAKVTAKRLMESRCIVIQTATPTFSWFLISLMFKFFNWAQLHQCTNRYIPVLWVPRCIDTCNKIWLVALALLGDICCQNRMEKDFHMGWDSLPVLGSLS